MSDRSNKDQISPCLTFAYIFYKSGGNIWYFAYTDLFILRYSLYVSLSPFST